MLSCNTPQFAYPPGQGILSVTPKQHGTNKETQSPLEAEDGTEGTHGFIPKHKPPKSGFQKTGPACTAGMANCLALESYHKQLRLEELKM